jgi:hypothetical protein
MNRTAALVRTVRTVLLLLLCPAAAIGAESYIIRTNWVERSVTNQVEVRMPLNVFVNQYRTNWVEHVMTNILRVQVTNHVTRVFTNKVAVDLIRTNYVLLYQTNWTPCTVTNEVTLHLIHTNFSQAFKTNWTTLIRTNELSLHFFHTNFVDVYRTNWATLSLTNEVAVNALQTNVVVGFRTNWQTLLLTNWQSVLVMKTNWITQPFTNIVQVDMAAAPVTAPRGGTPKASPARPDTRAAIPLPANAATQIDGPIIVASKSPEASPNNLVEVQLRIRWPANTADSPPVKQWRLERQEGAFLSFGQEQTFTKELSPGTYKVEVKLQWDEDAPILILAGTLTVTAHEAFVQQKTPPRKLLSSTP